jgi:hypothetical protein
MILPDLNLPKRRNQCWDFSGIDHIDRCLDKQHFLSYPHNITYNYNSRGFRDQEWPDNMQELQDAIWCIGDSFTVGLGSPLAHTWPYQLSKITNQRIINVSLDGGSNEWIARTAEKIVQAVDPAQLVIMWSYTHRREHHDILLSDEDRRIFYNKTSAVDDWENFVKCYTKINSISKPVHFAIPGFHSDLLDITECWENIKGVDWPASAPRSLTELYLLPPSILSEIDTLHQCLDKIQQALFADVVVVNNKDLARDGHHFDLNTSEWVATTAANLLRQERIFDGLTLNQ